MVFLNKMCSLHSKRRGRTEQKRQKNIEINQYFFLSVYYICQRMDTEVDGVLFSLLAHFVLLTFPGCECALKGLP